MVHMHHASLTYYICTRSGSSTVQPSKAQPLTEDLRYTVYIFVDESLQMESEEVDSQRRQERLRRRRQHDARARETAPLSLSHVYKFLHALRAGCSRSLPLCATGNGLQTVSLAACSGSPHNAHIH